MPSVMIDLTEMVRMAMWRPKHSPLFRAWEEGLFTWVTSELVLAEFVEVTDPRLWRMIRPQVRNALVMQGRTHRSSSSRRGTRAAGGRSTRRS
jgi:hypothetical protein